MDISDPSPVVKWIMYPYSQCFLSTSIASYSNLKFLGWNVVIWNGQSLQWWCASCLIAGALGGVLVVGIGFYTSLVSSTLLSLCMTCQPRYFTIFAVLPAPSFQLDVYKRANQPTWWCLGRSGFCLGFGDFLNVLVLVHIYIYIYIYMFVFICRRMRAWVWVYPPHCHVSLSILWAVFGSRSFSVVNVFCLMLRYLLSIHGSRWYVCMILIMFNACISGVHCPYSKCICETETYTCAVLHWVLYLLTSDLLVRNGASRWI